MVLVADTAYINGDFSKLDKNTYQKRDPAYSGRLMYFDINGKFTGGWRYQNGIITKTLTLTYTTTGGQQQINSERPKTTMGTGSCTVTPVVTVSWICTDFDGTNHTASIRTNSYTCEPTYNVTGYILECSGGGGSSDGGVGGTTDPGIGTGGNTSDDPFPVPPKPDCPPLAPASIGGVHINRQPLPGDDPCAVNQPIDCAGVKGGSAYLTTCGCIGGTTGVATCPPDIKNNVKDPCLKKMVDATINANINTQVNNLIQSVFGGSTTVNLTFIDVNNLTNTTDGFAPFNGNIVNGTMNAEVQLNVNTLPHYSQEYIARVIMHESLHPYLDATNTLSEDQHEKMMVTYVSKMANSLQQMFPSLSLADAQSLAIGGLQETPTFINTIAKDLNLLGNFEAINMAYSIGPSGTRCN